MTATSRTALYACLALGLVLGGLAIASPASAGHPGLHVGELEPGDCLALETDPQALAKTLPSNESQAENTTDQEPPNATRTAQNLTGTDQPVPTLCGLPANDTLQQGLRTLVEAGNTGIRTLEGAYDQLNATHTVNRTDQVPFLHEPFTRPRTGGLGDWQSRTRGDAVGFRDPVHPANGDGYALTDRPSAPYEHGLNTVLITPAIDLGGAAMNQTVASFPRQAHQILEDELPRYPPIVSTQSDNSGTDLDVCLSLSGQDQETCTFRGPLGQAIVDLHGPLREAYLDTAQQTGDAWARQLEAIMLDVTHRYNLAEGLDGVRYEVLTNPPPGRGLPAEGTPIQPVDDGPDQEDTGAFGGEEAFTGRLEDWTTRTFDLSRWAGQRVWIAVHARTSPAFGTTGFFEDPTLFPDGADRAGFQLDRVYVNASAHAENLRVLDIDAGQASLDGTPTVAPPLSEQSIDVAVTNQGQEPTRGQVHLEQCWQGSCASTTLGTVDLAPGEVARLDHPYLDASPRDGNITFTANLSHTNATGRAEATPEDNELTRTLHVDRVPRLDVKPAADTTLGLSVSPDRPSQDTPVTIQLTLENTGNVPVDVPVQLSLEDARRGGDRADWLATSPTRNLSLDANSKVTLSWTVEAQEGAVLTARAHLPSGLPLSGPEPSAHVFIDRSPGAVCIDDFGGQRSCGAQWERVGFSPVEAEDVDAVTIDEDGTIYFLQGGTITATETGTETREIGQAGGADWLVTTHTGPRAVGEDGEHYRITSSGVQRLASIPLDDVATVAQTEEGRLIAAGEGEEHAIAVALERPTGGFALLTSPPDVLPGGELEVTSVVDAGERIALSVRRTTEATPDEPRRSWVHLCTANPSLADAAIHCVGQDHPGAVRIPVEAGGRAPRVDLARAGERAVLVVEAPFPETVPGLYRLYLVQPGANDPTQPMGEGLLDTPNLRAVPAGGRTWLINDTENPNPALSWFDTTNGLDIRATLLPSNRVVHLGGGAQQAVALARDTDPGTDTPAELFTFTRGQAGLSFASGDWEQGRFLQTQSGDQTWSTFSGNPAGELQPVNGRRVLRGDCEEHFGSSLAKAPNPSEECLATDEENVSSLRHVNLTLRYSVRELAAQPIDVRLVLSHATREHKPGFNRRQDLTTPSGGVDPGALAVGTLQALEGAVNAKIEEGSEAWRGEASQEVGEASIDEVSIPETGGRVADYPVRGEIQESGRVDDETERRYPPHQISLSLIDEPTGFGWRARTWDAREAIADRVAEFGQVGVLGVEVVFPDGTLAAVDAAWLNATYEGEPGEEPTEDTVLFTKGGKEDENEAKEDELGSWHWSSNNPGREPFPFAKGVVSSVEPGDSPLLPDDAPTNGLKIEGDGNPSPRIDQRVTPVVDLREASDPRLTFRHGYAFGVLESDDNPRGRGWVAAQVQRPSGEWSGWIPLDPEDGYPVPPRVADPDGFRRYVGSNLRNLTVHPFELSDNEIDRDEPTDPSWRGDPLERRLWRIQVLYDGDHWRREVYDLEQQPIPLEGRHVRFAFFLRTQSSGDAMSKWAISDVAVLADAHPSVDPALGPIHFEGFNATDTGLPPGRQVTFNVTIRNQAPTPIERARVQWELVGVGHREATIAEGATPVASIPAGETTWASIPLSVPDAFEGEVVFEDDPRVYVRATLDRVSPSDEDPTNNEALLGDAHDPVPIHPTRSVELGLQANPTEGAPSQPRQLRVLVENTGNVPLEGLHVNRTILEATDVGFKPVPGERHDYETTRELRPGETRPLASLVAGLPSTERVWTPGEAGRFLLSAAAELGSTEVSASRTVTASEVYLNAPGEQPATGKGVRDHVTAKDGWQLKRPGVFGSPKAWHLSLADNQTGPGPQRHVLRLPTVDLSTARSPVLSLYQKYEFEERFDGARLEASLDGGDTWITVPTATDNGPAAYGQVLGSNPLANGSVDGSAFTGASNASGQEWVFSRFDLSSLGPLSSPGTRAIPLEHLGGASESAIPAPVTSTGLTEVYTHPSWQFGSDDPRDAFTVHNLALPVPENRHGPEGMLYAGTVQTIREEGGDEFCVEFDFPEPETEPGEEAKLEWWEWRVHEGRWVQQSKLLGDDPGEEDNSQLEISWSTLHENEQADLPQKEWLPGLVVDGLRMVTYRPTVAGEMPRTVGPQQPVLAERDRTVVVEEPWSQRGSCNGWPGRIVEGHPTPATPDGGGRWQIVELQDDEGTFRAFSSSPMNASPPGMAGVPDRIFDRPWFSNARLVAPELDLTNVEGNVSLSFEHMPLFTPRKDLGAVEASVRDPRTGQWSPWQQIYASPDQVDNLTATGQDSTTWDYVNDITGGYNAKALGGGPFESHPHDPLDRPGKTISMTDDIEYTYEDGIAPPGQYVYNQCRALANGRIQDPTGDWGNHPNGGNPCRFFDGFWEDATFPLDRFTGHKVRLAFHVLQPGDWGYEDCSNPCPEDASNPAQVWDACTFENSYLYNPVVEMGIEGDKDGPRIDLEYDEPSQSGWQDEAKPNTDNSHDITCPTNGVRWLLRDFQTHRPLFQGQPVDLRLVAATDGSEDTGSWTVDQIQIASDDYTQNLGLRLDDNATQLGPGQTASVTGEVRNHGTQTRTDVAVRARLVNATGSLTLDVQGQGTVTAKGRVTSAPFGLSGAEARSINVTVHRPADAFEAGNATVELEILQWNDAVSRFTQIGNDEVLSNLDRIVDVDLLAPGLRLADVTPSPTRVRPGEAARLALSMVNPAPSTQPVEVSCKAQRIDRWPRVDHDRATHEAPLLAGTPVPCTGLDETVPVAAGASTVSAHMTPPEAGAYHVQVSLHPAGAPDEVLDSGTTRVWAGETPLRLFTDFETADGTRGLPQGWQERIERTGPGGPDGCGECPAQAEGQPPTLTDTRAGRGNWSIRMGIPDEAYREGQTYPTLTRRSLISPPVDLHNVTGGPVALSVHHLARFAFGDGADVQMRVLEDEASGDWTGWAKLSPAEGYDGFVSSWFDSCPPLGERLPGVPGERKDAINPGDSSTCRYSDINPAKPPPGPEASGFSRAEGFFGSQEDEVRGEHPLWHGSDWAFDVFPLAGATPGGHPVYNHTVQFAFTLYTGRADGDDPTSSERSVGKLFEDPLDRGRGQGWWIDSVAVSATNLSVHPGEMRVPMVDNATKRIPIRVDNDASIAEHVDLAVDRNRSTVSGEQAWTSPRTMVPAEGSGLGSVSARFARSPVALPFEHTVRVEPTGKLNPNNAAETELTLDFDPRTWPDLGVEIREPDTVPIEGVPALIPVQVENHGQARSPATTLNFTARHDGDVVTEQVSVASLPAASRDPSGARTAAFVPWTPARGTAGNHTIAVHVDPGNAVPEYTETDNADARRLQVRPLRLPDVAVHADELAVEARGADVTVEEQGPLTTVTLPAGALTTVTVPIENEGDAPAQDVDVRLALGSTALPAERVSRLAPGDTVEVSFTFRAREGTQELSVRASSASRDPDVADNRGPREGTVRLNAVDFNVDLETLERVVADVGEPATVQVNLTNRGTLGSLVRLAAVTPENVRVELARSKVFLSPASSRTVTGTVSVDERVQGGDHPIRVQAVSSDDAAARAETSFTVNRPEVHDLDLALEQRTLLPGASTLPLRLVNDGNLDESLALRAHLGGEEISQAPTEVTVPRGSQRVIEVPVRVGPTVEAGGHNVTVSLEGTHTDERRVRVDVPATSRAQIRSLAEQGYVHEDGYTLPVRVANAGNRPLEGQLVLPADRQGSVEPASVELAPGEGVRVEVTLAEWTDGESVELLLRGANGVEDARRALEMPDERPDLRVLRHELDQAPVELDRPSELTVWIGNPSTVRAENVTVGVYLDGELIERRSMSDVGPDTSQKLSMEWPAFEQDHTVTVAAGTPYGLPDADPADNAISVAVGHGETGVFGGIVEELRRAPGPGVVLLVVIAGLAAKGSVALRRRWD